MMKESNTRCSFLNIQILFLIIFFSDVNAQDTLMHNPVSDKLSAEFHKGRREMLREKLPNRSCAVIFSYPERNRSNDVEYEFHQNPDLYYLTGLVEPNAILVISKESVFLSGKQVNEILFIEPIDYSKEKWTGKRSDISDVRNSSAIIAVVYSDEFSLVKNILDSSEKILITSFPKGTVNDKSNAYDLHDLTENFKSLSSYPSVRHDDYLLGKILRSMREIKTEEEINLIRKSVDISVTAHLEMMKALKPGMTEYQVEAIGEYVFKNMGAKDAAYPSICGSAENSCILHYYTNRRRTEAGDLILLDMGSEFFGYAADITRTLPVDGKFSVHQKAIYELVLKAQKAAIEECKPGKNFNDPHSVAQKILKDGLLSLGILNSGEDLSLYYPHGTSHYLGLDVHDAGTRGTLKAGMVLTVEPGLYIPKGSPCDPAYWNIGIRIEDNILITESGNVNLSESLPRETSEIEEKMKEPSVFD